MESSPAEQALAGLTDLYERALEAALAGDYDLVQTLVTAADPLLQGLPDPGERSAAEIEKHRRAVAVFTSLVEAVVDEREQTVRSLGRVRHGQRALAGYGGRLLGAGTRIERDG